MLDNLILQWSWLQMCTSKKRKQNPLSISPRRKNLTFHTAPRKYDALLPISLQNRRAHRHNTSEIATATHRTTKPLSRLPARHSATYLPVRAWKALKPNPAQCPPKCFDISAIVRRRSHRFNAARPDRRRRAGFVGNPENRERRFESGAERHVTGAWTNGGAGRRFFGGLVRPSRPIDRDCSGGVVECLREFGKF